MINKNAGMITVTATGQQLKRLDTYLADLQKKMQTQVLIDVKMYSVVFSDAKTTGVDWSQLYALQNVKLGFDFAGTKNIDTGFTGTNSATSSGVLFDTFTANSNSASVFQLGAQGSLNEVIKF
jgi:general secretion pathway protein D